MNHLKQTLIILAIQQNGGNLAAATTRYLLCCQRMVIAANIQSQNAQPLVKKYFKEDGYASKRMQVLQPFSDIHLDAGYGSLGDHTTDKKILWTLSFIGVLIIVMASINFYKLLNGTGCWPQ